MSNYIITNNGELYHYGVKGMKWGVRNKNRNNLTDRQIKKYAKKGVKTGLWR